MPTSFKPLRILDRSQAILEEAIRTENRETLLQPSFRWAKTITWTLIGGALFTIGWLSIAKTEEIVVAPGKLEPIGSVKQVQIPLQGVVKEILVNEGQSVKKGQLLIRLDTESSLERQQTTRQSLELKKRELLLKQQELLRTQELLATRRKVLEGNLRLNQKILDSYEQLSQAGAVAELQVLQQRNTTMELAGEIEQTMVDARRQQAILEQNLQTLRGEIAELNSRLTEAMVTLRYQEIRSPVNGVVFDLKPKAPGFVGQSSEPVMSIVPYDVLKARVEISSSDIGFVRVGKPADISIDSFPASDFGVLEGTVTRIGSDALPPDSSKGEVDYRFPADITLSSQQLKLNNGTKLPLQVGMSVKANIKLRKVTYLQLLLTNFSDKAESLRRI